MIFYLVYKSLYL